MPGALAAPSIRMTIRVASVWPGQAVKNTSFVVLSGRRMQEGNENEAFCDADGFACFSRRRFRRHDSGFCRSAWRSHEAGLRQWGTEVLTY
jgi:hypothetical protein